MVDTDISAVWWIGLVFAFGLTAGWWLDATTRRWRERWDAQATNAHAKRGEQLAHKLLVAKGYKVLARQKRASYSIKIDQATQTVDLIFDYEVQKRGETMVAEVKTGATATRIETAETRRQLLEYQFATGTKRVVLVDPDTGTVREVAFPVAAADPPSTSLWPVVVTAVLVAVALAWQQIR